MVNGGHGNSLKEISSAVRDEEISTIRSYLNYGYFRGNLRKELQSAELLLKIHCCWYYPATTIFRPAIQQIDFLPLFSR